MNVPDILKPDSIEEITLPPGNTVQIPKTSPIFTAWSDEPVKNTYGGKPILNFEGKPTFAELVLLRLLQENGWQGVWVDTFGRKYRTEYWPKNEMALPAPQEILLQKIFDTAGSTRGCWDVYCWKDDTSLFAESKWAARDKIRDTQRRWLQAALQHGLPVTSFLVVEWSIT